MAATTLKLGWESVITIDTLNVGDFVANANAGGWTSGNLSLRRGNVDSTNVDTAGYEGKEYGVKGAGLTLECLDDVKNDTFQDQMMDDYEAGTKRWIRVRPRVGTGYFEWIFQLVLASVTITKEQTGIVRFSLAGDSHGTITAQAQA